MYIINHIRVNLVFSVRKTLWTVVFYNTVLRRHSNVSSEFMPCINIEDTLL